MKMRIFGALFLLASCSALAQGETYVVESTISKGEDIVGEPTVILEAGNLTTLSVQDQYTLSMLATPGDNGDIYLDINLTADNETVSPKLLVTPGQSVGVKVGETSIAMVIRNTTQEGT